MIVRYAVLSLTVIRMVPVALIGTGLGRATVALMGWFGPRGLASVIFALLALEEPGSPTADPLAIRYARLLARQADGRAAGSGTSVPSPGMKPRGRGEPDELAKLTHGRVRNGGSQAAGFARVLRSQQHWDKAPGRGGRRMLVVT